MRAWMETVYDLCTTCGRLAAAMKSCPEIGPRCLKETLEDDCSSLFDKKAAARSDIRRLKWNWLFVCLVVTIRSLNHSCPLPTIHQFIINPTAENLNITSKNIQPGLQQTEAFYSLTYSMFYLGHVLMALLGGYLSNKIPMWYLFVGTIVLHIIGYSLYALSVTGWMMMVSRILAGISMGAAISVSFSYLGFSTLKYAENLRTLDEYDAKKFAQAKGYIYSLFNVGTGAGYIVGALFPIVLAQFDVDQFRPPGWFCAGIGVLLLLLQLAVFRGECSCSNFEDRSNGLSLALIVKKLRKNQVKIFCTVGIPLYILLVGGVKGARYVIPDMLLSPILADSFGFSEEYISYFFLSVLGSIVGTAIVLVFQALGFRGYFLSVVGGVMTMSALLIMTDWQAIPYDPCTELSIFHNPDLAEEYRIQLSNDSTSIESYSQCNLYSVPGSDIYFNYLAVYIFQDEYDVSMNQNPTECFKVNECPVCDKDQLCMEWVITGSCQSFNEQLIDSNAQSKILCRSHSFPVSCFIVENYSDSSNTSLSAEVHLQSLKVVRDSIYELAVETCESSDQCYWIPNSYITHQFCPDCQPICRSKHRTLNFAQFTVGLALLMCTMEVMYIGMFLLLSDSVSKEYQGICAGAMVASIGTARSTAPLWLDFAYEGAGKRTFLPMLLLFSLIFPLWLGLLILYPWIAGKRSYAYYLHKRGLEKNKDEKKTLLISGSSE